MLISVEAEDQHRLEQLVKHLELAVAHRTTIGMALGILMERYNVDHEAAFARLRRASSVQNRKLYDIASELIDTRVLPDALPTAHQADRPTRD
jgi:AmiR/NasT family two-component response regulator